ncbi:hypothetical protein I546_3345 [Mycobacterium kansasii 732]|nr:hypothetical protein I546_3345 [Mycobacterium kansasii 732]
MIDEITVMLRPLPAVGLFAEKMRAELARGGQRLRGCRVPPARAVATCSPVSAWCRR